VTKDIECELEEMVENRNAIGERVADDTKIGRQRLSKACLMNKKRYGMESEI
jgi:hypothetical protein